MQKVVNFYLIFFFFYKLVQGRSISTFRFKQTWLKTITLNSLLGGTHCHFGDCINQTGNLLKFSLTQTPFQSCNAI